METFMIKAAQLIVALLILVTVHEFGHYIFARIFGIKVNRFYLFFNPWFSLVKYYPSEGKIELVAWTHKKHSPTDKDEVIAEEPRALYTIKTRKFSATTRRGKPSWAATVYGLGWLPLGGYCDIAGMVDETTSASELGAVAQPWEFRSKAAWKRFMVMVAGVLFNFLLAIAIYIGVVMYWGERVVPFDRAYEGMDFSQEMRDAGFRDGDVLLTINDRPMDVKDVNIRWDMVQPGTRIGVLRDHRDTVTVTIPADLLNHLANAKGAPFAYRSPVYIDDVQKGMPAAAAGLMVDDRIVKVAADTTPSLTEFFEALEKHKGQSVDMRVLRDGQPVNVTAELTENGKLGIGLRPIDKIYTCQDIRYNIFQAVPRGCDIGVSQLVTYVSSLKLLFTKEGVQQVGGFGAIGGLYPDRWNWYTFWYITAFLSVILAFMNIIPIPALDGGYVLFLLWEIITGRKVPDRFLEVANTIGFALLFLLLIYANGNDLLRALR